MDTEINPAVSRRGLLRGAGAAGVVAAAVGGVGVAWAQPLQTSDLPTEHRSGDEPDPIVVHVRDLAAGELDVFSGPRYARITDRDLAARLARAARR